MINASLAMPVLEDRSAKTARMGQALDAGGGLARQISVKIMYTKSIILSAVAALFSLFL